uniref:ATP synthase complex subunit 8 n=1 Tax=Mertensiella caucasica TaxID=111425 RepID=B8R6V6_9SALA|nr:ATP synthase F0 subunit 8 [Mertensiella caucasica]
MPQLNPDPWFTVFLLSWTIYLITMFKMNKFKYQNNPTPQNAKKDKQQSWYWPWA